MQPAGAPRGDAHVPVDTAKIVGGSRLLGEMRDLIRRKHYSIRTEQAYLDWAKRYILFHDSGDSLLNSPLPPKSRREQIA